MNHLASTLLHYAIRELINHRRFVVFFVLNLSLGLMGFVLLLLTRDAVQNHFSSKLRDILGADWAISSREPPSEMDQQWLAKTMAASLVRHAPADMRFTTVSSQETLTMVHGAQHSRLLRVMAVDDGFPLYGDWRILRQGQTSPDNGRNFVENELIQHRQIWLDAPTALSLGAKMGESLSLGNIPLTFAAEVITHPSRSLGFTSLLPTVYISRATLAESGLMSKGSRVLWKWSYRLEKKDAVDKSLRPLDDSKKLTDLLANIAHDFRAEQKIYLAHQYRDSDEERFVFLTPVDTGERIRELTDRVSGFMNLISLIGLFFSGLGLGYLFRYYAHQRIHATAISQALGMTQQQSQTLILIQLFLLAGVALVIAFVVGWVWSQYGLAWLSTWIGQDLKANLRLSTLLGLFTLAITATFVFTFPVILRYRNIKPALILRLLPGETLPESNETLPFKEKLWRFASLLPAIFSLWLAAVLLVDWRLGSQFFALLLLTFMGFVITGLLGINIAHRVAHRFSVNARLAIRALYARRYSTLSGLIAIALSVFLMALLPQMAATLRDEVRAPTNAILPAFFLFDIQDEQLSTLKEWIRGQVTTTPNIEIKALSPQVRGRITHINDRPINDAKVQANIEEGQKQFIRQGVNITYRESLSSTETLVQGRALQSPLISAQPEDPVEISLEERYSARLGVTVGDTLTFMIHGINVKAIITNIRKVHWNSFQPNFFIQFPLGVLEHAPKTWVANLGGVPADQRLHFQSLLAQSFSNISAIDVGALVEEVLALAQNMVIAVYGLAFIALFAGITVMVSVALTEVESAAFEFGLIKVLGGGRAYLLYRAWIQFTAPCAIAALMGALMATLIANGLSHTFLQSTASYPWNDMVLLLIFVLILLALIFWSMARRMIHIKSGLLLNAD